MKASKNILMASAIFAGVTTSCLQADYIEIGSQPLTIALTTQYIMGGTFEVDPETGRLTKTPALDSTLETYDKNDNLTASTYTEATKAVKGKLGNKEILTQIKDDYLDGTITGWSINVSNDGSIVASKKGQDDVVLDMLSYQAPDESLAVYNYVEKFSAKYDADGFETSSTTTRSQSGTLEGPCTIAFASGEGMGLYKTTYKGMTYYSDPSDKSVQEIEIVPGAGTISGIIGSGTVEDKDGNTYDAVYGGSIKIAAAKGTLIKE